MKSDSACDNALPSSLNVSNLDASVPPGTAGLTAVDRAGLVNVLKDKLQLLAGQASGVLEPLSSCVKRRVVALQDIQKTHDQLEAKFFEEKAALEARYQKLYEPLYNKRYGIVNGDLEVEGVSKEALNADDTNEEDNQEEKGVPDFWLNAIKTNELLAMQISERDEAALKYLKDVRWCKVDNPKGFKLEFFFDTNPYLKNTVLTKTYHMMDDEEAVLERATGTKIEWHPGKNLTEKVLRKKPKKGSRNTNPVMKTEQCESFFNFFNPPQVPEDDGDIDLDLAEELQDSMEQDYDIGSTIRDKIIPHAVSWFTGEALQGEELEGEDDEESETEDEDDEENEDEDDDGDEKDEDRKWEKVLWWEKHPVQVTKAGKKPSADEQPPQCQQQ